MDSLFVYWCNSGAGCLKITLLSQAPNLLGNVKTNKNEFLFTFQKLAHPNAKELMSEDFFWSPIVEAGPFGSDSGSEAAEGYKQWRKANAAETAVKYLGELLVAWGMPL
ncbi:MAG: hypothetical protein IPG86_07560 [Chitinophagaceae bacterium]|nr:hypothetical protein [Chitinophagaceae bacterium]